METLWFPSLGIKDGKSDHQSAMLVDDFRGHSNQKVKAKIELVKDIFHLPIMGGGLTPKSQPLDVLVNKVFKGLFHDQFEEWSLNAPINPVTDHPIAPSRQVLAIWVVNAWDQVPEELIRK